MLIFFRFLICITFIEIIFFATGIDTHAQIRTSFETSAIISSGDKTPFWLQSNRRGIYADHGSQLLARFQTHGETDISDNLSIFYGADLIARPGKESTLSFNQGYLKIQGYGLEFSAGRFHNASPIHNENLSSGSLGVSTNAAPIPQLRLGLTDWTSVPYTNDFIEIKGHISHGWLGSNRYIDDVLIHEKLIHLRFGGDSSFKPYTGLAHYVKWGGTTPDGREIPARFRDFVSVFFANAGDERTPGPDQTYALGNHLGALDIGFFYELNDYEFLIYRQFPFEDKSNLLLKSYMDALTGISIQLPESSGLPFNQFNYEYLFTKHQAGPRESRGEPITDDRGPYRYNENYYNHYFYRTGWVYNMRTIGNPLFTPSETNLGVVNNRIIAHHIGFISEAGPVAITGKATFSRNYGKRCDNRVPDIGEGELFGIECVDEIITVRRRSLEQWSFLLGMETPIRLTDTGRMVLTIHLAYDNGRLAGDQWGSLVGIRWEL